MVELSREPEPKIGPSANAQEKRGIVTERGEAFRAAQARNAQRQELGWRQLELRLELMERGRAFIATARERLDQLWGRAEVAMSRIRERFMGEVERSQTGADRGDMDARRAAVLVDPRCKRRMSGGRGLRPTIQTGSVGTPSLGVCAISDRSGMQRR